MHQAPGPEAGFGVAISPSGTAERLDRSAWAWIGYEAGRNPYIILCTIYILAPYIATTLFADPVQGQVATAEWQRNAGILVALTAPLLGAIADRYGRRKPLIALVTALAVPMMAAFWWAYPEREGGLPIWAVGALVTGVGMLIAWSEVLHNALLPVATTRRTLPYASGLALAMGNLLAVTMLVFVLWGLAFPGRVDWPGVPAAPLFGLDPLTHETSRITGPLVAAAFALLAVPLLLFARDRPATGESAMAALKAGMADLIDTLRTLFRDHPNAGRFLVARMLYTDGKTALLIFAGIVAAGVLDWDLLELTAYGVILSVFAVAGGFLSGWLDSTLGPRRAVGLEILVTAVCVGVLCTQSPSHVFGFAVTPGVAVWNGPFFRTLPEIVFLAGACIVAVSVTAAYASSRTLLVAVAPEGMAGRFFGLYALAGAATAWLGPLLVGAFTTAFQSQQIGLASILILLAAGWLVLLTVRDREG